MYSCNVSLFSTLYGVAGQRKACTHFIEGWRGSKAGLVGRGNSLLPPGCDPRAVQLASSRYTDYAIPAHN